MLISQLNVVLYWRRRAEETPPGAITFYVTAREFPTRRSPAVAERPSRCRRDVGPLMSTICGGIHGIRIVIAHHAVLTRFLVAAATRPAKGNETRILN